MSREGDLVWARLVPVGLITLVFNLGGGLIAPALPLYARSLGADYRDLGLIGASHGLAFAVLTMPLGRASDRFGRQAILLVAGLAVGGAAGVYLASGQILGLAAAKLLEAAGWAAFWPALEAWVAERFGARAGSAMGLAYGAYAAAFVIGTGAGGFVIERAGLRVPFALYLVTSAVTVVLILTLAREPRATGAHARSEATDAPRIVVTDPRRARIQRLLAYGTGFIYVYGLGTVLAFLPAYAADRGLSPSAVGLLLAAYWIARVVGSLGAGRLSDRFGRQVVLVPGMLVAGGSAALVAAPAPALLVAGAVGLGVTAGAFAPTCVGLIADHVSPADRGVAMGLFEASCGVSILLSGLVGGYAAEGLGPGSPYLVVAALALVWTGVLASRLTAPRPHASA